MSKAYILVVDDEPEIRSVVKDILEDEGYEVDVAEDAAAAQEQLRRRKPELLILDIWMPDLDGISLIKSWTERGGLPCPVIMISGHGNVETAVEATRLGAYDYLEKPLSLSKLLITIEKALDLHRLEEEKRGLEIRAPLVGDPVGSSMAMSHLREQVKRVAMHDTWVLIKGEAGAGKETLARYLYQHSSRRNGPFVDMGVGAITKENAAVELFGLETEEEVHYGLLEKANGGVLFLDEIGDMDIKVQGNLISALETGSFMRVGGSEPVEVDVRIVAATRLDLVNEVREKRFREDLFYHLNVVPIDVPALRDRKEDVPELLDYYVEYFSSYEKLPYRHFTLSAQNFLRNYEWPGNVRELKNLVQRLLIMSSDGEVDLAEIEANLLRGNENDGVGWIDRLPFSFDLPLREARIQFEKAYLKYHLHKANGSVGKLALSVGMERTHLYRKLRNLGIKVASSQD